MKIMNFGGKPHQLIHVDEVAPGDYIDFCREGLRTRKVKEVYRGRKKQFISFEPVPYNEFKKLQVHPKEVIRVWREITDTSILIASTTSETAPADTSS